LRTRYESILLSSDQRSYSCCCLREEEIKIMSFGPSSKDLQDRHRWHLDFFDWVILLSV
jgi:hypothetical protein